jgi:hemerythrin-like domain-containing protein
MSHAATMAGPIAHWHTEHVYFRQLLDLLHREVDVFAQGERPNYELMSDIVSYLTEYSDMFHHPREDVAFTRLAQRCPDMRPALARLAQEHRVIARAGATLRQHIESILDGGMVPRDEVEVAAATYLVYYGNHIAKEEEDVLTLAAKHLTAEDWQAVKDAVPPGRDPLFGGEPQQRFGELRRRIGLEH